MDKCSRLLTTREAKIFGRDNSRVWLKLLECLATSQDSNNCQICENNHSRCGDRESVLKVKYFTSSKNGRFCDSRVDKERALQSNCHLKVFRPHLKCISSKF